jgi:hypothetical protein
MPEPCRFWLKSNNRCGRPATVIVWGKFFSGDQLGPRCHKHAVDQIGYEAAANYRDQYAVYRIENAGRDRVLPQLEDETPKNSSTTADTE